MKKPFGRENAWKWLFQKMQQIIEQINGKKRLSHFFKMYSLCEQPKRIYLFFYLSMYFLFGMDMYLFIYCCVFMYIQLIIDMCFAHMWVLELCVCTLANQPFTPLLMLIGKLGCEKAKLGFSSWRFFFELGVKLMYSSRWLCAINAQLKRWWLYTSLVWWKGTCVNCESVL